MLNILIVVVEPRNIVADMQSLYQFLFVCIIDTYLELKYRSEHVTTVIIKYFLFI